MFTHIYLSIYIEREREKEREVQSAVVPSDAADAVQRELDHRVEHHILSHL
jgi:hypothetical protein